MYSVTVWGKVANQMWGFIKRQKRQNNFFTEEVDRRGTKTQTSRVKQRKETNCKNTIASGTTEPLSNRIQWGERCVMAEVKCLDVAGAALRNSSPMIPAPFGL